MLGSNFSLSLSLFVAQGRERDTAEFYKNVFGATETNCL
jgi:PhnB protein